MIRHILTSVFLSVCYIFTGFSADAVSCIGRTQYSASGAATCAAVDSGYYTTGCDADGNNCTGQAQCDGGTYCTGGVQYECPVPGTHMRTTFPDNYYNPTISASYIVKEYGRNNIDKCWALSWLSSSRGGLYEYVLYNSITDKYDKTTYHAWADAAPGYYLTTKSGCGSYAYYEEVKECPAGSYCPGKARVACNPSNQATVHTETFGLEPCPAGSYCPAGAAAPTPCPAGTANPNAGAESASACVPCTGRTQYSASGAATCAAVGSGYYTTGCDADGNNCTGQAQCAGTTYCTGGVQYDCPDAETHMRTTFPDNYYNPTIASTFILSYQGRSNISDCRVLNWMESARGALYEYDYYNPITSKYDILYGGEYGWSDVSPGYYLTTKGACGDNAYYLDNKPCPAGSYCPGKTAVACNPSNQAVVHTETFGLEPCPAGYYSAAGASACSVAEGGYYTTDCNDSGTNCTGRAQCPASHPSGRWAAQNINDCYRACMGGSYMANASDTQCTDVGTGYWAARSETFYPNAGVRNACPAGTTTTGTSYGADEAADCGHVLNIDGTKLRLRSAKKTSPSLAVGLDDMVYYANMSQNPHNITAGSTRFLKSDYNNSIYYIYDDTAEQSAENK